MDINFEQKMWKFYKNAFWSMESMFLPILNLEDLTISQASILFAIQENDRISVGELSENAKINKGNCSSTCKKLEKFGYLVRERDKGDERRVELELTQKGKEVLAQINDGIHRKYNLIFSQYSEEEAMRLMESIEEVNHFFGMLHQL